MSGAFEVKSSESNNMVRVFEFFSGIGGMRLSLQGALAAAGVRLQSDGEIEGGTLQFTAFDTSELVNQCYRHNFPGEIPRQVNIESIKLDALDGKADIWTMSPPCQPFTATKDAKRLDAKDNRNKALVHLMGSLEKMKHKPVWIFFENVKGFENSETHIMWTECLIKAGYSWRQFLLSPFHFRIPNGRTRFYMAAHLNSADGDYPFFTQDRSIVHHSIPKCLCETINSISVNGCLRDCSPMVIEGSVAKIHEQGEDDITGQEGVNNVAGFLEKGISHDLDTELTIPDSTLQKNWAEGLSIVGAEDRCTFCFTSAYGQTFHRSTGSMLHKSCPKGKLVARGPDMSLLHSGQIRLFSPREMLNFFGFPENYTFADTMSSRQKYRVIGQSVNVVVVRALMHSIFCTKLTHSKASFFRDISSSSSSKSCEDTFVGQKREHDDIESNGSACIIPTSTTDSKCHSSSGGDVEQEGESEGRKKRCKK